MGTPEFIGKDKNTNHSQQDQRPPILWAPKKYPTKKTLQIQKIMILQCESSSLLKRLRLNDSPQLNEIMLQQARILQDSTLQTPQKEKSIFEDQDSTIVQNNKRKFIDRDIEYSYPNCYSSKGSMIDENASKTERKHSSQHVSDQMECEQPSQEPGKKIKPLSQSSKSSIKFSSQGDRPESVFVLSRDREIHPNISRFHQSYKKQAIDNDCSTDDEQTEHQIMYMTESLVDAIESQNSQGDSDRF